MADGDLNANGENQTDDALLLQAGDDGSVSLPDGHSLSDAGFQMVDGDLVMSWSDGTSATVEGFSDSSLNLVDSDGAQMTGDMAQQLAQIDVPAAQAPDMSFNGLSFDTGGDVVGGTDGAAIGNVDDLSGSVWAVRVDGSRVELNVGDPVYQGDILESGPDGSVGVILADETTFSMGEDGRMVLDEMVYDPGTQEGAVSVSVLEGVFTFVSGQVAKTDPDAMTIDTPVATIGIRGTQVGINVEDGEETDIVLMEEGDGFVGEVVVQNDGGVVILNEAFAGTNVQSFDSSPEEGREINQAEFLANFGDALKALPAVNNANTYGITEQNLELMIEEAVQNLEAELEAEGEEELTEEEQAAQEAEAEAEAAEAEAEAEAEAAEAEAELEAELEAEAEEELAEEQEELVEEVVEEINETVTEVIAETNPTVPEPDPIFEIPVVEVEAPVVTQGSNIGDDDDNNRTEEVVEEVVEVVPDYDTFGTDPVNVVFRDGGGTFTGTNGNDYNVIGGAGADIITTADGSDFIYGGAGDDYVDAGAGDDRIVAADGSGDDIYIGGTGNDWITFESAGDAYDLLINVSAGDAVDLILTDGEYIHIDPQTATDASDELNWIDVDTLIDIENVLGGAGDDIIAGSSGDNILAGGLGSDILLGGDGDDILIGGTVDDFSNLSGSTNADGHDLLIGGDGFDIAVYSGSFGDYEVNVDQFNQLTITGPGGSVDKLISMEGIYFGDGEIVAVGLPPVVSAAPAAGDEDAAIALNIEAGLADGLGALASVTISDIPEGSVISIGTDENGDPITVEIVNGDAVVPADQLANLTITPPENYGDDFALTITAEREIGFTSEPATLTVNVTPVADAPELTVSADDIFVEQGQNATFDIAAVTTDTSENIVEVQVSGIPEGGKLFIPVGDGSVNVQIPVVDGVATIPVTLVDSVIIQTPEGYNDDYDLVVSATSEELENGDTATTSVTVHVDMQEEPVVTVNPATGDEDTAIPLDIAAVVDGGESIVSVTIADIPEGSVISVGTDGNGDPITVDVVNGSVTLTPDQLLDLAITPPDDDGTDFTLSVTATGSDGGISDPVSLDVTVVDDIDEFPPVVTVTPASGNEDGTIPLDITVTSEGGEVASVSISGIPAGAVISVGTDESGNPITVDVVNNAVSVTPDQLANLSITPAEDDSTDLNLTVSATSVSGLTSDDAALIVDVTAVADAPVLDGVDVVGAEDTAIDLDISAALTDLDGSESISDVSLTGLEPGSVLSFGTDGSVTVGEDGSAVIAVGDLDGLQLTPPADYNGVMNIGVAVTSTEVEGDTAISTDAFTVTVDAVDDVPVVTVDPASGTEDKAIALTIDADVVGTEDVASVTISDIPDGSVISIGTDGNGDPITVDVVSNAVTLTPDQLANLSITPPADSADDFNLKVTATSTDGAVSAASTLAVTVAAVADAPTVSLSIGDMVAGETENVFPLTVEASLTDDDQSESLAITISLIDAPAGAALSAGTDNGDGSWTLTPEQLVALELTVPSGASTDFTLEVTAVATETENQDTATTTQTAVVDLPEPEPEPEPEPQPSDDAIVGTESDDVLDSGGGGNEVWGMGGDDDISGRGGDDELHGGDGNDSLDGSGGIDALFGDLGEDFLSGGGGDDILTGGAGDDVLNGGGGADTFIFDAESGSDIIQDIMEQDSIVFEGQEFHAEDMIFNENEDGNVEISFQNGPDTKVTLEGVSMADLDTNGDGDPSEGYSVTESDGQLTVSLDSDG